MSTRAGHAAVVLAAGGSRRLGQAKQLLVLDGETLIHRAARLAAGTAPAELVVVLGAQAERVGAAIADLPARIVLNPGWQTGMAGSLRAAAPHVSGFPAVLVLACDQPALQAHHLNALLQGAARAPARCAASDLAGVAGIPAVVPGDWFGDFGASGGGTNDRSDNSTASERDQGFRHRLRALPARACHLLAAPELSADVDLPADLWSGPA